MSIKLTFLGAAQNVTGSRYLVEACGRRILVDCGLYQERRLRGRNWEEFPVPPESIHAVLLTHAHLDHVGYLPRLVADGFRGTVHSTAATAEIARIVLLDSGRIQEEDAAKKRRRHKRERRRGPYPVRPLYTEEDAERTSGAFAPVDYGEALGLGEGIEATFHDAGHILGSSMLKLAVTENGRARTILFSGDVGRWDKPILRDPTLFDEADCVVVESTYGDRLHKDEGGVEECLEEIVNSTHRSGGNLLIPSFAVERAHELMYHLNSLLRADRIPHLMVFLDSPMAVRVTKVFQRHEELYDEEMTEFVESRRSPFSFPGLKMTNSVAESKAINHIRGTAVIIAGSGMCTGGRIKHHLVQNIERRESTLLFIGYQASGTLGRIILGGAKKVRIFGRTYRVRARVRQIHGFSGHADRDELFRWVSHLRKPPRRVFVTHGEPESARSFAGLLEEKLGVEVSVPGYGDEASIE